MARVAAWALVLERPGRETEYMTGEPHGSNFSIERRASEALVFAKRADALRCALDRVEYPGSVWRIVPVWQ